MFNIKRFPHIMRAKKRTVIPSNFIFFDTETKLVGTKNTQGLGKHQLWFGWAYAYRLENGRRTREVWFRFTTGNQFFNFIKSRCVTNKPLFVYAHNLGFDLPIVGFLEHAKQHGFRTVFHVFSSPPTIFKCKYQSHTINFVDTLNYWTVSLAKLGESIGLPKLEMPVKSKAKPDWDKYARRDVEIIALAVDKLCKFVLDHQCGSVGLTLASLAMNAYRFKHMTHDIFIHDRLKVLKLERDAYYGGLVDCFFVGKVKAKKVYNVDITSHYPHVMLGQFPCKLIHEQINVPVATLKAHMRNKLVIATVLLNTKHESFPKRSKDKLCYCCGRFITTLCTPELERAIGSNAVLKVRHMAVYEKAPIFRQFVNYFWSLRMKYLNLEQETDAFFCKILLNSLYGKFGQRGVAWADITPQLWEFLKRYHTIDTDKTDYNIDSIPIESDAYYTWKPAGCEEELYLRNVLDNIQVRVPIPEHHESFPAIAAFVTSYGRETLLNLIHLAGSKNCYYCDTDSLFVNPSGLANLKKAGLLGHNQLGKLKIASKSTSLTIRGPKDYTFGDKVTIKGIRKDAVQTADNVYEQIRFEGIKGIIRRGGAAFVEITKISKTLKRVYDKGLIGKDGWTRPFNLGEF